jgi:hypothetical protein
LRVAYLLALLPLAACGPAEVRPAPAAPVPVPSPVGVAPVPGAAPFAIEGASAQRLIAQFGAPQVDLKEGAGRKLQFLGPACVLDAYLYPPQRGRGDATVRHIDTRRRDGAPIDQASCVAALTKR